MKIINKLARDKHLTIDGLEKLKVELAIRKEYERYKLTESQNQLLQFSKPSFSLLSLIKKRGKYSKSNKIKSLTWVQGIVIGYKVLKSTKTLLKKRRKLKKIE